MKGLRRFYIHLYGSDLQIGGWRDHPPLRLHAGLTLRMEGEMDALGRTVDGLQEQDSDGKDNTFGDIFLTRWRVLSSLHSLFGLPSPPLLFCYATLPAGAHSCSRNKLSGRVTVHTNKKPIEVLSMQATGLLSSRGQCTGINFLHTWLEHTWLEHLPEGSTQL